MAGVYLDTSPLGRLLLDERDAPAIQRTLSDFAARYSSRLMRVELLRLGNREGLEDRTGEVLEGISLAPLDEAMFVATEALPPATLGTLDAIHLATALRLAQRGLVDAMMTYDRRLGAAARDHGLEVLAPV